MKKIIVTLLALLVVTTVNANPDPCNTTQKKRTSYSKYCRMNNIKETKNKKIQLKKSNSVTTLNYLNPMFR